MIIHLALFRWKPDIPNAAVDQALERVRRLQDVCDGIDIFCGQNTHPDAKGFTHGVVVVARDQAALDRYRQHPDHQDVAEKIEAIEEDSLGFDFPDR
ncbi:MAG: Dabb family protein [Candidatus Aenigmarchaeota archaeon]|nr:Dabb family protein [Candidatus Aenigmarchaeota archaeon]